MKCKPTVFIVEDDSAVSQATAQLVDLLGYQAESYDSAEAFLRAYEPTRPACLVADVRMAGMGGLELQEELVARGTELPIVFITGHADKGAAVRAVKAGAVEFLEKPFRAEVLSNAIRSAIAQSEQD